MDPLSVAASAIALGQGIKVLTAGIQRLTALRKAPAEIYDIHNEVRIGFSSHKLRPPSTCTDRCVKCTTIACYLELASSTLTSQSSSPVPPDQAVLDHINAIVLRVQAAVQELQQVADGLLPQSEVPTAKQRATAKVKWLFEKDSVVEYRDKIRRERESLADAFRILQHSQT